MRLNGSGGAGLTGLDFLENVIQGLAKGTLQHVVPVGGEDFVLGYGTLSDILINHYCPTPSMMTLQDFPSMSSLGAKERVVQLKKRLLSWDFHPHDLCEEDLMRCVVIVIQEVMKLEGLGDLNIPEHLLHRFVIGLRDSYHRSNPYHNFAHAVDVLQATFYFLCRMGKLPQTGYGYAPLPSSPSSESEPVSPLSDISIDGSSSTEEGGCKTIRVQDFLRAEDIFALVVASIGHDVGHPGVNNMFLINAHTPLAQVYNDRSVLESFHSMALFQVMKKHGFECFDVDSQNRKFMEFRKMVVSTILATDMGLHFDYVGKIKEQNERLRIRNTPAGQVPKPNQASIDEQERLVLCGTLIKCADISNASRPFHVAERWSSVLLQEMCNQADIEKEMAVSSGSQPVPDVQTKSLANDRGMQIDSQLGFIHGFAMPLFASVRDIIPDLLQINHKIWEDRKTDYLQNGGSGPLPLIISKPVKGGTQVSTSKVPSSPRNRSGHHSRARSQASKQTGANHSIGSETAAPPKSQNGGNVRRSPKATSTVKATTSGSEPSTAASSSIPRPRSRVKAATAEGEVLPKTYGQTPRIPQSNGRLRQQSSRDTVTSKIAQPTTPTTSVPATPSGPSSQKLRTDTPSKPTISSHAGQKSPGRRSQGPQSSGHGSNAQQQHHHNQHERTITLSLGAGAVGGTQLEHREPIVLGSLLPVDLLAKNGVVVASSPDRPPSQAASSPLSPPLPRTPGSTKSLGSPGISYSNGMLTSGKRIHQKQDYFGLQPTATASTQD
ncbi:3',5'-cyclic-nucleotide phosphodiesterase [Gryganskiella cystojenkinii]|nr:3',5'-cyclic-nucleotide phosphodiesterase [Gryganskiella cystojenkinii]